MTSKLENFMFGIFVVLICPALTIGLVIGNICLLEVITGKVILVHIQSFIGRIL